MQASVCICVYLWLKKVCPVFNPSPINIAAAPEHWSNPALPSVAAITPEKARLTGPPSFVVPHRPKRSQHLVAWTVFLLERLVSATLRCRWKDDSGLAAASLEEPVIFCLWHNRLAISMMVHRRHRRKLAALVSASKDGALLAAVLGKYGVHQVRGSSSRRGPQALLEMTSRGQMGYDLAVTPDGPRGPRYIVQAGVISLAQVTGYPIIPVTCNYFRKLCLGSWDGFQIPFPFSRCDLILNKPFLVPREAGAVRREELRQELQTNLNDSSMD
jgi:lysophospholipid acyltransferase (LPLAT)-like uncharacterized protein